MTLEDLKKSYAESNEVDTLGSHLKELEKHVHLKGLVGSADAVVAASLIEKYEGTHLFILGDKEEAAYFLNNLENLDMYNTHCHFFPESYRQPYQTEKTDNSNIVLRAEVLNGLSKRRKRTAVVTYAAALCEKVVTQKHLEKNTLQLKEGESYSFDFIEELLFEYEFEKVDYVYEPGQFSVRGGIIDVFSFSDDHPYRIELFGDDVESIRSFDTVTQLSIKTLKKINIVPNVQKKLLQESRQSFLEFIGKNTNVWIKNYDLLIGLMGKELEKVEYAYERLDSPLNHLPPEELYVSPDSIKALLKVHNTIEFGTKTYLNADVTIDFAYKPQPTFAKNFELLLADLRQKKKEGFTNLIVSESPKQIERLDAIFEDIAPEDHTHTGDHLFTHMVLGLHEGFIDINKKLVLYTDHQIFERYHRFKLKEGFQKTKQALTIKELNGLQKGDFVTHIDHGIGRFDGLEKIDVNGKEQEAIRLVYKGNDILYISIHSLHRIAKYTGKEGTEPKMNKLGTAAWSNLKNKTKKRVKEVAFDLIKLYAERKAKKGFAYSPDSYLQTELEASFIYEDTPDQEKATEDVKRDMENEAPMDRLICGDVGFGKTEIAMRAAFKAVTDSKQVAVLVPTTILTFQHYKNFVDRLKEFPVTVDYINRFKSTKKQKETLRKLESGEVDIIIGTHRIVGKDVKFKDLGLLIIDEEQKFGVSVKDKLKTFKTNVDTLTLTATPIPRTLQFSLMGARDLSVINTPPPNRHPVETKLIPFNEEVIRDAITYEVSRGGQVYYVHNRVQNIKDVAGMIQRLCPDVRIGIGHGQMEGAKLEAVMMDFMEGLYDVLLATTIIESGIDVSNANTMIINDAQNFGLSDLHQLRGRVGRSNKKAFCYLITPPMHHLSSDSRKRLNAIEQFSDLGSGFNISMRDLDIRGAGDMLGAEQSGFINDIGFEMYQKILKEAVNELKEEEFKDVYREEVIREKKFVEDCAIETDLELLIPDDYVNQIEERLALYKELDDLENEEQLYHFEQNLVDRFGDIPHQTMQLMDTIRLRWLAKEVGFEKIILKSEKMICYFISKEDSPYYQSEAFTKVLEFVKNNPRAGKMYEKNGSLRMSFMPVNSIKQAIEKLKPIKGVEEKISLGN